MEYIYRIRFIREWHINTYYSVLFIIHFNEDIFSEKSDYITTNPNIL